MNQQNEKKSFYDHSVIEKPNKLAHIKNTKFLDNTLNPLNMRYIKKIWVHKKNKLGNDNRHLAWEYYKDRNKNHIAQTLLKAHYANTNDVVIIYFNDPVQYRFTLTAEMITELKMHSRKFEEYKKAHKKITCIDQNHF
jgi:hypothetical protein